MDNLAPIVNLDLTYTRFIDRHQITSITNQNPYGLTLPFCDFGAKGMDDWKNNEI